MVHIHGLAGDRATTAPALAGPAAVVEYVPAAADVVEELAAAGFVEIAIDTLSARPPFVKAGVPLRGIRVTARTPTAPSPAAKRRTIYLGPMAQVTDDFGNVYRRGRD